MKRSTFHFGPLFSATLFLLFVSLVMAQRTTSDLAGTVQDTSGGVIPEAKVELTNIETSAGRSYVSDSSGGYVFAHLNPGHYTIRVSKPGFKVKEVANIQLLVEQNSHVDVVLEVGEVTQEVNVSAGGVQLLETENSTVGQVIQGKPIVGLPLNGRNFIQLTQLAPLMNPVMGAGVGCSEASNYTGAGNQTGTTASTLSAIGLREQNVSYLLDGIETRNPRWGNVTLRPSPDAIQEFKMETTNFGPETGRSSIVVNTTLKSGSNAIHGSGYEFLRNSQLDSNDFFLNLSGRPRPQFQQNNFGASLGGPVRIPHLYDGHDKTFFFVNYEGLRSRKGLSLNSIYPSRAQLSGNLADDSAGTGILPTSSSFCQANPKSPKCVNVIDPSSGLPFPGNVVPANRLDLQAQRWIPFMRVPNVPVLPNQAGVPSFNFAFSPKNRNDFNQAHVRVDQNVSQNDRFFGSYSFMDVPHVEPSLAILGGLAFPWRAQVLALNETHTFSPRIVNEFRYGYKRSRNAEVAETAYGSTNYETDVFGLKNFSNVPVALAVPNAGIAGFGPVGSSNTPLDDFDHLHQFVDNLSIVHGKHNIKLGINVYHEGFMYLCDCTIIPRFTFDGRFTGSSLGDMLLGIPYQITGAVGEGKTVTKENFYAAYLGDDIHLRRDLTINLGVRYEYQQWPRDINGHQETYDPAVGRIVRVFANEVRNGIVDPDYNNFAPRVGFAYSPSFLKNTVIRSSYGIFFGTDNWNEFGFAAFGPDLIIDCAYTSNPVKPSLFMRDALPSTCALGTLGEGTGVFGVDRRMRTPYIQEWNFNVQHTFGRDWLFESGYVGNVGQKIPQRTDWNTPSYDPTGTIPVSKRRPNPLFDFILATVGRGWSSYNGGFVKVEKRIADSFFLASYTWSKALDLGQDAGASGSSAAFRDFKRWDRGLSAFDTPHRFVASYLYALPFGRGKRFFSSASGLGNKLVSAWSVDGITTFQAGQFESPNLGFAWANLGSFIRNRPDLVGSIVPANRSIYHWFDASSFALPGCPTLAVCSSGVHLPGNSARNNLQMPGLNNWDLAVLKETKLTEALNLQFRAEAFNAFNHPQWGTPNNNLRSLAFGTITSLRIQPREVQFGLKLLW